MPATKRLNYPFDEIVKSAEIRIAKGWTVFQKFTCANCGQRLTMPEPNQFHVSGDCDQCGAVTDIQKNGCNFLALFSNRPQELQKLVIVFQNELNPPTYQ